MMTARLRNLALVLLSLTGLGLAGLVAYDLSRNDPMAAIPIGGPFRLQAHDGATVTDEDFRGRYMMIYFGYTSCPDVCPTKLAEMGLALDAFAERDADRADRVTPIFISVDPARDTPAVLDQYRRHFHPRLVALTGSLAALKTLAGDYKTFIAKVTPTEPHAEAADYLVDHSAYVFLMGPDGRYREHFTPRMSAEQIAARLDALVED